MPLTKTISLSGSTEPGEQSLLFHYSALAFRIGLALVTFEQDRPFGIMLSDYCFFLSLVLIFPSLKGRLLKLKGSGVLLAGGLVLSGALLSLGRGSSLSDAMGPLLRLFILYGLFAPLALIHSNDIRKNMLYLVAGISLNCAITMLQAWAFPGILYALSINPQPFDVSDNWRLPGLTEFPVTLGLSAALGVLLALGLLVVERRNYVRWGLAFLAFICSVGALLSGSRTFLAALIPGLIVLVLLQKQRRRAIVHAVVALTVLGGLVNYFAPQAISQYSDRLSDVGLLDNGRLVLAAQAVVDISQKPILGWGIDHFGEAGSMLLPDINDVQPAHVTLFQYWYGAGLLGAIGFLTLFGFPAWQMLRDLKKPPNKSTNAVRLILACYLAFFVIVNLGPYLYNRYLYIPMFVFAGYGVARQRNETYAGAVLQKAI